MDQRLEGEFIMDQELLNRMDRMETKIDLLTEKVIKIETTEQVLSDMRRNRRNLNIQALMIIASFTISAIALIKIYISG